MATAHPIKAAIFDMDGLLIDSEPLWLQAELDIFTALGLDTSSRDSLPDTLGLRIDLVSNNALAGAEPRRGLQSYHCQSN
ncbi:phosphatase YniC [Yersinia pestis Angola]|nr:phosphatase YniC [Yersinia pestis Angola]